MARSNKNSKAPLYVAVCGLAVVGGLGYYIVNSPGRTVPETKPLVQVPQRKTDQAKVYNPSYDRGDLKLKPTLVKVDEKQDPRVFVVNEFLAHLKMVPSGAKLKTCRIESGIATLDFAAPFETSYGTEDEQTVLKGILTTMGQFEDVKQVRFTVEGRTLESLGNVDLTAPQDVIRQNQTYEH